jgi:hypothetical protein
MREQLILFLQTSAYDAIQQCHMEHDRQCTYNVTFRCVCEKIVAVEKKYDMIYLLIAIGLPPGGSCTVHIYTQTVHRTTQNKQYTEQHKHFENNTNFA